MMTIVCDSYQWNEEIPNSLNYRDAPDIRNLSPVDRAMKTAEWFNKTRKDNEKERKVVEVRQIDVTVLWSSDAN
jgi:hypothetical protein